MVSNPQKWRFNHVGFVTEESGNRCGWWRQRSRSNAQSHGAGDQGRKGATGFRRSIRHSSSSNGSVGTNQIECNSRQLETGKQKGFEPVQFNEEWLFSLGGIRRAGSEIAVSKFGPRRGSCQKNHAKWRCGVTPKSRIQQHECCCISAGHPQRPIGKKVLRERELL